MTDRAAAQPRQLATGSEVVVAMIVGELDFATPPCRVTKVATEREAHQKQATEIAAGTGGFVSIARQSDTCAELGKRAPEPRIDAGEVEARLRGELDRGRLEAVCRKVMARQARQHIQKAAQLRGVTRRRPHQSIRDG